MNFLYALTDLTDLELELADLDLELELELTDLTD